MAQGDFGIVPGTRAVAWELTLAPSTGCGVTPAAACLSSGICSSGGSPQLARGLATTIPGLLGQVAVAGGDSELLSRAAPFSRGEQANSL